MMEEKQNGDLVWDYLTIPPVMWPFFFFAVLERIQQIYKEEFQFLSQKSIESRANDS